MPLAMAFLYLPVAINRETLIITALAILAAAGVVVSWGAWALLRRERRATRRPPAGEPAPTRSASAGPGLPQGASSRDLPLGPQA